MMTSSRGLGGSMPGEDLLRSARALSKGLRETEVPKDIIDTVSNLDAFIKEQQITQAKVSALCQMSGSVEESPEFGKIQHVMELAPEVKDLLEKTAAALEGINCALRDMQVSVNLVWQKAQVAGLPLVAGTSAPLPVGRPPATGAPKLTPYFEATMRRLEEQVTLQQRRLDELMASLSSSQDPIAISSSLPDVILSLNQSIICLAAKVAERHERVARLQQKLTNSSDFEDSGSVFGNSHRMATGKSASSSVGINPFQLASGSSFGASNHSRTVTHIPPLGTARRQFGLTGGFESNLSNLPNQPSQHTGTASGSGLSLGGHVPLSTPSSSLFGTGASSGGGFGVSSGLTSASQPQVGATVTRPWSSDTTNNRFSSSFSPAGAGQLDLLGTGKRSRAL